MKLFFLVLSIFYCLIVLIIIISSININISVNIIIVVHTYIYCNVNMYLHYIMPDSVTPKQNTLNHNIGFSNLRCKKRVFLK